jgi:hypothetical protein
MPNDDKSLTIPLSQQVTQTRMQLLDLIKNQLDNLLSEQLTPQPLGIPFVDFSHDSPQLTAIKKLMNCLYHAELGLKTWEGMDTSTKWNTVKSAPQGVGALVEIYQSMVMLNDATPELRELVIANYTFLAPLFFNTYKLIQESGWVTDFSKMGITEKAFQFMNKSMTEFNANQIKSLENLPVFSTIKKISDLMELVAGMLINSAPGPEAQQRMDTIHSILNGLENELFINEISLSDLKESKAITDLLDWFKGVQSDGFNFTKKSIEGYIKWSNSSLLTLIQFTDHFERQNYLKHGLLSKELCNQADNLGKKFNEILNADKAFNIENRVITINSLTPAREKVINENQITAVKNIVSIEKQQTAARTFYEILRKYKKSFFADIVESDRVILRRLYPKIQTALAHANLGLENECTQLLNEKGPKSEATPTKSYWQKALNGLNYVTSFIANTEIDALLATEKRVAQYMSHKMASEQFKIKIAEKSRVTIQAIDNKVDLNKRVEKRIDGIKTELKEVKNKREETPKEFVPIKAYNLSNLYGTFCYLRHTQLSQSVQQTRKALEVLMTQGAALAKRTQALDPLKPKSRKQAVREQKRQQALQKIQPHEPQIVAQIKQVIKQLIELEHLLADFEQANVHSLILHRKAYLDLATTANELRKKITVLVSEAQTIVSPKLQQLVQTGKNLIDGIDNALQQDMPPVKSLDLATAPLPNGRGSDALTSKGTAAPPYKGVTTPTNNKASELQPLENGTVNPLEEVLNSKQARINAPSATFKADYMKQIKAARNALLHRFQTTLSAHLSSYLIPQDKGLPFIDFELEPPQLAAIKKIINSLYHAESAINNWQNIDTNTTLGAIAGFHQAVAALSQVYKSLELFTEALPEVHHLIHESVDYIWPLFTGAIDLVNQSGLARQFKIHELANKLGSFVGQQVALVQIDKQSTQTTAVVNFISKIPAFLNKISHSLVPDARSDMKRVTLNPGQSDDISRFLELLIEENSSYLNIFSGPGAIIGLFELSKLTQQEGIHFKKSALKYYQQWLEERYPSLLSMLDEIEVRHYLKPGTLSMPITLEIDQLNDKLNELVETTPEYPLKRINLSYDLANRRKSNFNNLKKEHYIELIQLEDQQNNVQKFFQTLSKYSSKNFSDISPAERIILRTTFALIQPAMTYCNEILSNQCVTILNQLETKDPKQWAKVTLSIEKILKQESLVHAYLYQRTQAYQLKCDVIDEAFERLNEQSLGRDTSPIPCLSKADVRKTLLEAKKNIPIVGPGELKPIASNSFFTVYGAIDSIKKLKLSSYIGTMRQQFIGITKNNFSKRIQEFLNKPNDKHVYVIQEDEPLKVRQIKELQNALYHFEIGLQQFESLKKEDTLVHQTKSLLEIIFRAQQLIELFTAFNPEIIEHYAPLIEDMMVLCKKIKDINYNTQDWEDLTTILQDLKRKLLTRTPPQDPCLEKAFFDKYHCKMGSVSDDYQSTGKKAIRLGVKYFHLTSPKLEQAINYLDSRYPGVMKKHALAFHHYTRSQLADSQWIESKIESLQTCLIKNYGFNFSTLKIIIDMVRQLQRGLSETSELAGLSNELITDNFIRIKEQLYKEFVVKLSHEEDYLCLQPGALIHPVMSQVNQLFLSAALEIEMKFSNKLELMNDALFLNIVKTQVQKDIQALKHQQEKTPSNIEISLQMNIKNDKLEFLNQQIAIHEAIDINKTKRALLDIQFEVYLRDHLINTQLKKPIVHEYEELLRSEYDKRGEHFSYIEARPEELQQAMQNFEKNRLPDYFLVNGIYQRLNKISQLLPAKNNDVVQYIDLLNLELSNKQIAIEHRTLKVKALPNDIMFLNKLSSVDQGLNFLNIIFQFIQLVFSTIGDCIKSGENFLFIWNKTKLEQVFENIEQKLGCTEEETVEAEESESEGMELRP